MLTFDAYYINLQRAEARRKTVEANLAKCAFTADFAFQRFDAVDSASERVTQTTSSLLPGQTACYLSHMDCLEASLASDNHVVIAEDDVLFSPKTEIFLNQILADFEQEWDVLFLDLIIFKPNMAPLLFLKQNLLLKKKFELIDLTRLKIAFAGLTCYVINKKSKKNIHEILGQHRPMTLPIDVYFRDEIRAERIQAYSVFPFLTSISYHAAATQVPHEHTLPAINHLLWDTFRTRSWIDAGEDEMTLDQWFALWHRATN